MSDNKEKSKHEDDILIVGIGASAGGLEALKLFFSSLPSETGMAFIVIMHLAPDHESNMAELLQMQTEVEVLQVTEQVEIQPDHVYVIPPNKLLKVGDDHLELSEPSKEHGLATIDLFLRSLAKTKEEHAASIILSGTGSDGTSGMKAVKEHGGLTIVQDPEEAQYPGMPKSAIDSGLSDLILPVQKMAEELLNYKESLSRIQIDNEDEDDPEALTEIFQRIRSKTDHDFSDYKRASVLRRIKRRMQVTHVTHLPRYVEYLNKNPEEIQELFKDLLISVTNFFRDPNAFKAFEEKVVPKLFENKEPDEQVRVWVPGCATGEEAYSIAMLLREYAQGLDIAPDVKLFATDIDQIALKKARKGRYPQTIATDISEKRLDRHFTREDEEYQVKEEIREMILFAPHDLLRDPPFSKLDLLTCRNLLIYLNRELQSKVFSLFHYTLREDGYLFLGLSDSNIEANDFFTPLDKKNRLYRRMATATATSDRELPQAPLHFAKKQPSANRASRSSKQMSSFETLHRTLLAHRYAPESVIINDNFQVIHATDGIKKFLEYSGGQPSHDILEMVKSEIRQPLRSLLFQVEHGEQAHPLRKKVQLKSDGETLQIELIVHSIDEPNYSDGLIQVVFKEIENPSEALSDIMQADKSQASDEENEIINALEDELKYSKEQLYITVEEYETSNEELRASNEELQSMNEELQSTTEELETSQEELQSVNEELKTVNQQLENKIEKLDQANSDLKNLMESTEIGVMFIDSDLCAQRFTSPVMEIFNLIPSDEGRPLKHVTHKLTYDSVLDDIRQVLNDFQPREEVVSSQDGRWYIMRVRPYRSMEDKIEGVVLSFVEFTRLKKAEDMLREKARQEEALARLGLYAISDRELEEVAHRAVQLICETLELDYCLLYHINDKGDMLELLEAIGSGFEGKCPEDISIPNDTKWDVGFAYESNHLLVVDDYHDEQRFRLPPHFKDFEITCGINLMVEGSEKPYGVLSAYSGKERTFSDHDISFLKIIANLIGEAKDRKLADDKLKKSNKKLQQEINQNRQYQREIINNSVSERWELGSYLHDSLAQTLASIKILIRDFSNKLPDDGNISSNEIAKIDEVIDEGIEGIRDLTHTIIPIDIEEEGVAHAFRYLMQQIQKLHKVQCSLEMGEVVNEIKNIKLATNLYHVIQEAIKNAAIHGHAENVTVSIAKNNENLQLQIEDDGKGLADTSESHPKGRGIRIMKYRMELLGGTFDMTERTESGQTGMVVTCTIPLEYLMAER